MPFHELKMTMVKYKRRFEQLILSIAERESIVGQMYFATVEKQRTIKPGNRELLDAGLTFFK